MHKQTTGADTLTKGNRTHITVFGRRNSGKSTLINTLTGRQTSLTSPVPGTTTDPVQQATELGDLGPCLLIDTAGLDDEGTLGLQRVKRSIQMVEQTDLAILLLRPALAASDNFGLEREWFQNLVEREIPTLVICNAVTGETTELPDLNLPGDDWPRPVPCLDIRDKANTDTLIALLLSLQEKRSGTSIQADLLDGWVSEGDLIILVMPQDQSAPQGRLILPQSQTLRSLLGKSGIALCLQPEQLEAGLALLQKQPDLMIVDSQVLAKVRPLCPAGTILTTFSILQAAQKGNIQAFVEGSEAIDTLQPGARILIAESCAHAPKEEDIGRVKIPALLRKKIGGEVTVDIYSGTDFPDDLTPYNLIIQCGSCVQNKAFVLNRQRRAAAQGIPMTNYGIAIAKLSGILNQVDYLPPLNK